MNRFAVFFVVVALVALTISGVTAGVTSVDCDDYEIQVAGGEGRLVVVLYTKDWCAVICRNIGPIMERSLVRYPDVLMLEVNVDRCENHPFVESIMKGPHFGFFKDGQLVEELRIDKISELEYYIRKHK